MKLPARWDFWTPVGGKSVSWGVVCVWVNVGRFTLFQDESICYGSNGYYVCANIDDKSVRLARGESVY